MAVNTADPQDLQLQAQSSRKHRTLWGDAWVKFRRHKLAMFGLITLTILIVSVVFGPLVYRVDPEYIDFAVSNQPPSLTHPFGTDDLGRDLLARNLYGGRISLAVGMAAMAVSIIVGTSIGALAGFFSKLDSPLMRFTDMMLALPQLPLLLVIITLFRDALRATFGPELGIFLLIVFVIGILGWMPTSRIVRGTVLSIKEKEFVEAAVNIGVGQSRILSRHVLPNVLSPIIVSSTLSVAAAILLGGCPKRQDGLVFDETATERKAKKKRAKVAKSGDLMYGRVVDRNDQRLVVCALDLGRGL